MKDTGLNDTQYMKILPLLLVVSVIALILMIARSTTDPLMYEMPEARELYKPNVWDLANKPVAYAQDFGRVYLRTIKGHDILIHEEEPMVHASSCNCFNRQQIDLESTIVQ